MSFSDYSLSWSEKLIERVETHLRDIHSAVHQYYEREGFSTRVPASNSGKKADEAEEASADVDVVSPAGSFLLRTCVQSTPFAHTQAERGVGADLVITMPESKCSQLDVQEGRYLACRDAFLADIELYLNKIVQGAAHKVEKGNKKAGDEEDDDDNDEEKKVEEDSRQRHVNAAAAQRLSRMVVTREHIHGAFSNKDKSVLRLRFRRRIAQQPTFEVFYVDLHFRPASHSGRVMSAAAIRKHPYYSYLVLEDFLMPQYLKKMHQMCSECGGLRKALVILKCWAHHVGLMSAASGNSEGLNGFAITAMMLKLLEEGIVTGTMSEESAARTVWVRLAHGHFLPAAGSPSSSIVIPSVEERGEVAALRLEGEVMNVLFRTSASFMKNVVQPAAEAALQHPLALDVFSETAYQPLQLRHDVALTVGGMWPVKEEDEEAGSENLKKASTFFSPLSQQVQHVSAVLQRALINRASYVFAWRSGEHTMQVLIQLTSEADGRNHLTRGPAIEDVDAVEAFNAFWGKDMTSTRQFPDGAIYRCVLWTFPDLVGSNAMSALSASQVTRKVVEFALRKHQCSSAEVAVVLGGLEGVLVERIGAEWRDAAQLMQKSLYSAVQDVNKIITDLPRSSIPCKVTGFNVISASERNTEAFPVRPHLALTYTTDDLSEECYAGLSTAPTIEPIHCVLSIDDNGKIPDSTEAIAMMKGAIVAQLAKTIQQLHGPKEGGKSKRPNALSAVKTMVTSQSVDIIYKGYLFRVYIAHYREVSLLRAMQRDAEANVIEQKLFWTALHAKFLRSIVYGHHSFAPAVRLARRWVSAMLLGEFILPEAVELLVAHAYLQESGAPKTSAGGFMRFVQLLATNDWSKPLVLPYTDDGKDAGNAATLVRQMGEHQGMYIATPYAATESPFTASTPRPMIMHRMVQLAKGVVARLITFLGASAPEGRLVESEVFTSDPSAFDFHMMFHRQLILQPDRALHPVPAATSQSADNMGSAAAEGSSTAAASGTSVVSRIWQLDELDTTEQPQASRHYISALVEREPAAHAVRSIRAAVRDQAMVFYDALAPSAIHVVSITAAPMLKQSHAIHGEILRVCRGALLPAAPNAFTVKAVSSNASHGACGCDGDHHHHHHHDKPRGGKRQRTQSKDTNNNKKRVNAPKKVQKAAGGDSKAGAAKKKQVVKK